jgi:beta-alanine degradation protein BauB
VAYSESIIRTESPEVRVTEWHLAPGGTTGLHRHNYDCVVVPLTHAILRLVTATRMSTLKLSPGAAYLCKAGVEHVVFNAGAEPLAFVDVELKDHPG